MNSINFLNEVTNKEEAYVANDHIIFSVLKDLLIKAVVPERIIFREVIVHISPAEYRNLQSDEERINYLLSSGTKILDAILFAYSSPEDQSLFTIRDPQHTDVNLMTELRNIQTLLVLYLFTNNCDPDNTNVIPGFLKRFFNLDSKEKLMDLVKRSTTANLEIFLDKILFRVDLKNIQSNAFQNRIKLGIAGHRLPHAIIRVMGDKKTLTGVEDEFVKFIKSLELKRVYLYLHNTWKPADLKEKVSINAMCEHVLKGAFPMEDLMMFKTKNIIFKLPERITEKEFEDQWNILKDYIEEIKKSELIFGGKQEDRESERGKNEEVRG